MQKTPTEIPGCYKLSLALKADDRGDFLKFFMASHHSQFFPREAYVSRSHRNVVRGMHFQTPPHEHNKLVVALEGTVQDVVLDLRVSSPTYNKAISVELNGGRDAIFVPKGCAHGFLALTENAQMLYLVDSEYSPEHDQGILWSSVPVDWQTTKPIVSGRDARFLTLVEFKSPF